MSHLCIIINGPQTHMLHTTLFLHHGQPNHTITPYIVRTMGTQHQRSCLHRCPEPAHRHVCTPYDGTSPQLRCVHWQYDPGTSYITTSHTDTTFVTYLIHHDMWEHMFGAPDVYSYALHGVECWHVGLMVCMGCCILQCP